jgi:rfaE bifunctional protein nucleotidyltransferase chain/domain
VVGDAVLDHEIEGTVTRLVPDTPAPIVEDTTSRVRPGGAALAALFAARAGREVVLLTPIGENDPASRELRGMLDGRVRLVPLPLTGAPAEMISIRTRGRTLVRVDRGGGECGEPGAEAVDAVRCADAILVVDHGGGTTAQETLRSLLAERAQCVPLLWNPHPRGAAPVDGTLLATPSLAEALSTAAVRASEPDSAARAARLLLEQWSVAGLCMTLGGDGAMLTFNGNSPLIVPAPRAPVAESWGAEEAFAAALAQALHDGELPSPAVARAVAEAAAFAEAGGAATLGPDAPQRPPALDAAAIGTAMSGKPGSVRAALAAIEAARAQGARIVATGGCFDVLHAGHLACLRSARALGDFLVVCLNSDASVRRLKGRGKPVNKVADRAALLAALDCVDAVAVFGEDQPTVLLDRLRPDLWVKGGDYSGRELPEAALVASWGGRVATVPYLDGHSSSTTLGSLAAARRADAVA